MVVPSKLHGGVRGSAPTGRPQRLIAAVLAAWQSRPAGRIVEESLPESPDLTDMLDRLKAVLAGRYAVERELGSGGMAIVFLARDLKHDREVAIKVLRPELAAALGTERYLQEIHIAARLNNPHILPLHDSGEADGLLYYVMPYVEGESLRDRLDRERQLPVEEALQIAREVATGLSYAHSQGVVHRDIKPENILLSGETAVITDFGIARAISAAGGTRLTATGIAIGTPTYMSPEQVAGDRELDARSDLYSLGCLVYEMLAGEPPFTGPTVEAVIGKHVSAPPPQVTVARSSVPPVISAAIQRALAKAPADRYATASQFREALKLESVSGERAVTGRRSPLRPLAIATVVVAVLLAVVVLWPRGARDVDPDLVVVMPFRVAGAGLDYLREGMVDLLAAKLTGEGGPRAVDQRTVLSAWRRTGGSATEDVSQEEALEVAQALGAGRLLLGSVVSTPDRSVLEASLIDVPSGRRVAQGRVEGELNNLYSLVDGLTAQLLARQAGEAEQRLAALTSTSLDALKAYLDGQAAYRSGEYTAAARLFGRALEIDSTFALAALGLVAAKQWTTGGFDSLGVYVAWRYRDRLSSRDRTQAIWFAGSRYPEPSNIADRSRNLERLLEIAPDRPDPWYWGGEGYYHFGATMDIESPRQRAAEFFRRAFELDSSFTAPVIHLISLAARRGDSAEVRRLSTHYLGIDSTGNMADFVRWRVAVALEDEQTLSRLRTRFETMDTQSLAGLMGVGVEGGYAMEDVDRAAAVLERRADPPIRRWTSLMRVHDALLSRGRPGAALHVTRTLDELGVVPTVGLQLRVWDALYAGGDSAAAAEAVRRLESTVARARRQDTTLYGPICAVEMWRVAQGRLATASETIDLLRSVRSPPADIPTYHISTVCAGILEALAAAAEERPEAGSALAHLDSLVQVGFEYPPHVTVAAALTSARLHEARGEREAALAAVRRRVRYSGTYITTALREEGRLAAQLGDRDSAVRAYEHYLTLMSDPEPPLQPDVEQVRAELARLVGEGAGL